jgi:DNA-binding CsgD family transcriptional regulator
MVRAGWEILDLVEALVALNRPDEAAAHLAAVAPHPLRPPRGLAEVTLTCARAIVTDDYDEALTADLTAWPFVRARTLLARGGSLRRAKRATEAADVLRAARDELALLGATRFVDRAQRELRAAGEAGPAPTAGVAELTPHELRIAQLAASGLSNPEIARQLEVSPRTIGSHLYRIFPKLGITSRSQLATALERG